MKDILFLKNTAKTILLIYLTGFFVLSTYLYYKNPKINSHIERQHIFTFCTFWPFLLPVQFMYSAPQYLARFLEHGTF